MRKDTDVWDTVREGHRAYADSQKKLRTLERRVTDLENDLQEREKRLRALYTSTSWRITDPLRKVILAARDLFAWHPSCREKRDGDDEQDTDWGGRKDENDYTAWLHLYDQIGERERGSMREKIATFRSQPVISLLLPTYNSHIDWLVEAIDSVRSQVYERWELCIADDASTDDTVRRLICSYAEKDARIKYVFRRENGHISKATNSALELATGDWIALLDHDDRLTEHALFWGVAAMNEHEDAALLYSDEDKIDENGVRSNPYFKCDWNEDLFYSHNMITHLGIYRRDIVDLIGGFRIGFEGSQDYDLALRCIEKLEVSQIVHIPRVLYSWRMHKQSTASSADAKPYAMLAGERALNEHFQRSQIHARSILTGRGYRTSYQLPASLPLVTLIILTRDGYTYLRRCIESILFKTEYENYEILIIDNGSQEEETLTYLQRIEHCSNIRIVHDERAFNFSALNNSAVQYARGDILAFCNNDIEVIESGWLTEMVSLALRKKVGAVGAKLRFPDERLQHAGIILGMNGTAGHVYKFEPWDHPGYYDRAILLQGISAVTAACMLIRKEVFAEVGGFDEEQFKVAFNDVDFCLRVRAAGYTNIYTPFAELYHHESVSRGYEDTPEKLARFEGEKKNLQKRWGRLLEIDPAYSPNLSLENDRCTLAWPPRVPQFVSF